MSFLGLFGGSPSPDFSAANSYMDSLRGIAKNLGNQQGQAQDQYNGTDAAYQKALNQYSTFLNNNAATDQQTAEMTANADRGMGQSALRAKANMSNDLFQRGIDPNSSMGIGGLANINNAQYSTDAGIRAGVGERQAAQRGQNLNTLASLWTGAQGNAFSQNQELSNAQTGIYGNLMSEANQRAMEKYNADMQAQTGGLSFLGSLGNAAATAWGPSK